MATVLRPDRADTGPRILSCPLQDGLSRVGVLDLYVPSSEDLEGIDPADIAAITLHIAAALMQDDMLPNFRCG
jgi:hypothetical protein